MILIGLNRLKPLSSAAVTLSVVFSQIRMTA